MEKLLILGAGGFGRMIARMAEETGQYEKIAFLDDNSTDPRVVGKLNDYARFAGQYTQALAAIGNNALRLELTGKLKTAGFVTPVFVFHPAYVSPSVPIGGGTFVLPGAVINPGARVGEGCIINCGAIVDHDAVIEDGVHVCMNAVIKSASRVSCCTKVEAGQVVEQR